MQTSFNELDLLLNKLKKNFSTDAEMVIASITDCITTDTMDTTKWTDALNESIDELETVLSDIQTKKDSMKSIYDSVYKTGG